MEALNVDKLCYLTEVMSRQDHDGIDDDDDDLEPPSTFSVETVSPDDQKLNW